MAPKAMNARNRFDRKVRFRGNGSFLRKHDPIAKSAVMPTLRTGLPRSSPGSSPAWRP